MKDRLKVTIYDTDDCSFEGVVLGRSIEKCPFCQGLPEFVEVTKRLFHRKRFEATVECPDCGAKIHSGWKSSQEKYPTEVAAANSAIDKWNMRMVTEEVYRKVSQKYNAISVPPDEEV